ncbi:MAG TPA: glycosyltransferase [Solirubrobacterales bacterium]|nr:glycosyltransferase [Solirubrobacterales bacterium]
MAASGSAPRLLIVGAPISIHVVRNLEAIAGLGWDLHLFPSAHVPVNPELRGVTVHVDPAAVAEYGLPNESVTVEPLGPSGTGGPLMAPERAVELARLIRRLEPDLLHTMETQAAGYAALDAARIVGRRFPPWIAGIFGNDLYYYSRIGRHRARLRAVMGAADYLIADSHRDLALARRYGFRGRALPVMVTGGGFDADQIHRLRAPGSPSGRRAIAARLQAFWAYRPRVVLEALDRVRGALEGYELQAYFLSPELRPTVEELCGRSGMTLRVISEMSAYAPHAEILAMHGRSRVSLGASVSDGTALATIEAAVMGSLPVHSFQSSVGEWLRPGRQALLFDGEDPGALATALERALTDDELVDGAAAESRRLAFELDSRRERRRMADVYERVLADQARRCATA